MAVFFFKKIVCIFCSSGLLLTACKQETGQREREDTQQRVTDRVSNLQLLQED